MIQKFRIVALQAPVYQGTRTMERNLEWTGRQIDQLASQDVDIICLAEIFALVGLGERIVDFAQPAPGTVIEFAADKARKHNCNIICPIIEQRGSQCYNTAVVIDRTGSIVGKYDKIHPTIGEMEQGITPGMKNPPVIQVDHIKLGIQICFDANWAEDWMALKSAGAQIIFFCSVFSAGRIISGLATALRVPIVAATVCPSCRIIDRAGMELSHQDGEELYAIADLMIDKPLFHLSDQREGLQRARSKGKHLLARMYEEEHFWTIQGVNDPQDLQQIIDQLGCSDIEDYLARNQAAADARRR